MGQIGYKCQVARPYQSGVLAILWLGASLALAASCATTPPVAGAAEGPIVEEVQIEGARQISPSELKDKIVTSASRFPGVPLLRRIERFDPITWQADLRRLERYYQTRGYYQARVESDEIIPSGPDHVRLKVRIFEGEPARISELEVTGLEGLPKEQREQTLAELPLERGEVFLEEEWTAQKRLLVQRLREQGYAEASVSGEAQVEVAQARVMASLEVDPGVRYRVGNIVVATDPDAKVGRPRIVERVKGALTPGDWYQESDLAEAQARVFQMGVFAAVRVNRGAPDRFDGTVPIVVDVREAPFHTRRTGVGLGVDQTRQEARITGEYIDRNFFGGLRRYTLSGKVGYAFLPDVFSVARATQSSKSGVIAEVTNSLEQPRFFHPDLSLQSSLEVQRGIEPAYDFLGGSARVGVVWRPRPDLVIFPSYNLDLYQLSSPAPLGGRSPEVTFGCPARCVLSYLEQTIELDRRDDRIEPRQGFYAALSLQEGGGPLQGEFTYLRVLPDLRGYLSFGADKRTTIAGRVRLGTLLTENGSSPIVARFFSGGGNSMRGFNTRRLSPLLAVADEDAPVDKATGLKAGETLPLGGNGLFESSAEVRRQVYGNLVVAAFLDAGLVTSQQLSLAPSYFSRNLLLAAGFGIRYRTALGPIRVDVARRLPVGPPLEVDQPPTANIAYPVNGSCFGLGGASPGYPGSPEGLCAFHLSIGEAF